MKSHVQFELSESCPKPSKDTGLKDVAPLAITYIGRTYYPTFQHDSHGVMYRNIATCIKVFRAANPSASDWDILMWFNLPNESLEGKTPLEVGRNPKKDIRSEIVSAAEIDEPLAVVTNTWG